MVISEKNIVGNLVGTWAELYELMELANRGRVKLSMSEYKLSEANKALHDLNDGNVKGRAANASEHASRIRSVEGLTICYAGARPDSISSSAKVGFP